MSVCCGLFTITTTPIYVEVLEFPHLKVHTFPCLFISINHKLQENGNLEILFNLIGFELTPSLEQTAGFFLPDISLMWLSPDEANSEWKTRSWLKCFCFHGWHIIWNFKKYLCSWSAGRIWSSRLDLGSAMKTGGWGIALWFGRSTTQHYELWYIHTNSVE